MRLITPDDVKELYYKIRQRGLKFILSKFNLSGISRTKSAFSEIPCQTSYWWDIPEVRKRWNYLISGDENLTYEDFLLQHFLNEKDMKMLSPGSGNCAHEIYLAQNGNFGNISCVDIVDGLLQEAHTRSNSLGLSNMEFINASIYDMDCADNAWDVLFFNASLHHFRGLERLIGHTFKNTLRQNGYLVINEYVGPNRLQYPKHQLKAANEALHMIPKAYRKVYKTNIFKRKVYGPGYLRMYLADPSECVESSRIRPLLNQHFEKLTEKAYGGNILALVLKDIAHHFFQPDAEKKEILQQLFDYEDDYLRVHESDYIFAIYRKK